MALEDILVPLKEGLTLISSTIVNGIINFISLVFGVTVPPFAIQLLLIGLVLFFFWKWANKLPWFILIILIIFFGSFLMGLLSNV